MYPFFCMLDHRIACFYLESGYLQIVTRTSKSIQPVCPVLGTTYKHFPIFIWFEFNIYKKIVASYKL